MPHCCILDVGHGNAAVVIGDTRCVVVDAGPRNHLIKFLEARGIQRIDTILISHADEDHIGGLLALVSKAVNDPAFSIGEVYVNPDSRSTEVWDDLIYGLNRLAKEGKVLWCLGIGSGEPPPMDIGGCEVNVIAPSKVLRAKGVGGNPRGARRTTANTMSAVVRITRAGEPWIVLPGDLDKAGLEHLVADGGDIRAPVVVFPHHGGMAGSAADTQAMASELLQRTGANVVIFSAKSGSAKFPSDIVVRALLGAIAPPTIWSIGQSEILATHMAALGANTHHNGVGSISLSTPVVGAPLGYKNL